MKRSKHSLSHYKLFSGRMGEIIPIACLEVLPGDTMQHATSALIRLAPMLASVMHPLEVKVHHWFVPTRLLWEDWEDFITGGPDGDDESVPPTITIDYTAGSPDTGSGIVGGLADYLGVPSQVDGLVVSALPFRAYSLIFNEWYRDQDLVTERAVDFASGSDSTTATTMAFSAWEKDYFTSARTEPQKGPDITIPLSGDAPIEGLGVATSATAGGTTNVKQTGDNSPDTYASAFYNQNSDWYIRAVGNQPNVFADMSQVNSATINQLREAFALQRMQEARARYGSRYVEYLRYLGVASSDARLQRPEYLGGGKQTIQFSEVLQTAEGSDPVGTMRGHGIGAMRSNRYRRFFEEHGYVMSLMIVKPKTMYFQGLNRMWSRETKEMYWQKELEHIGQMGILNKEIYAAHASPEEVFGYQDQYDEYRRHPSTISGEFKTVLDYWHMAREFTSDPSLDSTFVTSDPTDRIFASTTTDPLYVMTNHSIQARRLVSKMANSYIF